MLTGFFRYDRPFPEADENPFGGPGKGGSLAAELAELGLRPNSTMPRLRFALLCAIIPLFVPLG